MSLAKYRRVTEDCRESMKPKESIDSFPLDTWPRVYLLGAQKAGTEAMSKLLNTHPWLCSPAAPKGCPGFWAKEPHHFDRNDAYGMGAASYLQRYRESRSCRQKRAKYGGVVKGMDNTPNYIHRADGQYAKLHPGSQHQSICIFRMKETIPQAIQSELRFIMILREPVSRDLSRYNMVMKQSKLRSSASDYWKWIQEHHMQNSTSALRGKYSGQLREFWKHFARNQTFVISADTLYGNTADSLSRLTDFLRVSSEPFERITKVPKSHTAGADSLDSEDVDPKHCQILHQYYQHANEDLYRLLSDRSEAPPQEPLFPRFRDPGCGTRVRL